MNILPFYLVDLEDVSSSGLGTWSMSILAIVDHPDMLLSTYVPNIDILQWKRVDQEPQIIHGEVARCYSSWQGTWRWGHAWIHRLSLYVIINMCAKFQLASIHICVSRTTLMVPDWSLGGFGHSCCHRSSWYVIFIMCVKFQNSRMKRSASKTSMLDLEDVDYWLLLTGVLEVRVIFDIIDNLDIPQWCDPEKDQTLFDWDTYWLWPIFKLDKNRPTNHQLQHTSFNFSQAISQSNQDWSRSNLWH